MLLTIETEHKEHNMTSKKSTVRKPSAKKTTVKSASKKPSPNRKAKKPNKPKAATSTSPKKDKAVGKADKSNHVESNPYRAGSAYATCFEVLAKMGKDKPVTRRDLLESYCKASGKDEKHALYDMTVILSPRKDGTGHRSSRKEAYWVERLENSMVQLHVADK